MLTSSRRPGREGHLPAEEVPPSAGVSPPARESPLPEVRRTGSETRTVSQTLPPALSITVQRVALDPTAANPVVPVHPRRTRGTSAASGAGALPGQGTGRGNASETETGTGSATEKGSATASVNATESGTGIADHRGELVMSTARRANTRATTTNGPRGGRGAEVSRRSDPAEVPGLDASDRAVQCISFFFIHPRGTRGSKRVNFRGYKRCKFATI